MDVSKKQSNDFTRVFDVLAYQRDKYPNSQALNASRNNVWFSSSIEEIQHKVDALSCWLLNQGFRRDDKLVLVPLAGNPNWMILDFACQQIGVVVVPVHPTSHDEEIEVILNETEPKFCIAENVELAKKFNKVKDKIGSNTIIFHLESDKENYFSAIDVHRIDGRLNDELISIRNSILPDSIVSILYTSGSSGIPKGVCLTHKNIVHSIKSVLMLPPLEPHHRVISFLPFSHILERVACYSYIAFGVSIYFNQSKETFARDFNSVKPYFCTSVPRVLEKMYNFMQEQMLGRSWIKRVVLSWAFKVGMNFGLDRKFNVFYSVKLFIARLLVFRIWRRKLGGKIRYMVVGAASLQPEIGRLFSAAGITIVEGYGMTETAPLISVNRFEPGMNLFGTVGMPIPGIDIKIDEPNENGEGEILVKGPNVMQGYYKRPELTAAVFTTDGWFRTGDVGKFVESRFLKITDRKKDIFKTSSGKYISPLALQNHLLKSHFIQQCLILGFQRPYVTALLVPNFDLLEAWCAQQDIHWTSPQFMVHNIRVRQLFEDEVSRLNCDLPNYQRIKNFVLCHQEWTVETNELTNTLKPIRKNLMANYLKEVDKMYEDEVSS